MLWVHRNYAQPQHQTFTLEALALNTGEAVDGMDVLSVKAAGDKAVKHCRAGKGPIFSKSKLIDTEDTQCLIQQNTELEKKFKKCGKKGTPSKILDLFY